MAYSARFDPKTNELAYPCEPVHAYSPPAGWDPTLVALVAKGQLSPHLPPAWCNDDVLQIPRLVAAPPIDCDSEIRDILTLQELEEFHPTLVNEAGGDSTSFIRGFLDEIASQGANLDQQIGKLTAKQHLQNLARVAFVDAGCVVMNQKALFNRPRPYQVCPAIRPRIFPVPGHASYPSGHSTQLHAIAFAIWHGLSGTRYGEAGIHLIDYVGAVARRREVAGLHYASDTVAGMALAKRIVDHYLGDETFVQTYLQPISRIFFERPEV